MAASNPAIGNNKALTNRPANDGPLSTILCRDVAAVDSAISNISANGVEAVADAISKGHSWNDIADYFGCTEAHLRSRWLAKLNPDEKTLIQWAERQFSERLIPHLIVKMKEEVETDCDEVPEGADPMDFKIKAATLKDKRVQTLERVARVAQAHASTASGGDKPEVPQQAPPGVNIIIDPSKIPDVLISHR